jgi:hypothetical protein
LQKSLSTTADNKTRFKQKMPKTLLILLFAEIAPRRGVVFCEPVARDQRTLVRK